MAKKKKKAGGPKRRETLSTVRAQIDRVDRELVKLLSERAKLAIKAGQSKQEEGGPLYDPDREAEVLKRVVGLNRGPLTERCVRSIFRELISASRKLSTHLQVAYLGPAYTYSHLAAFEHFGQSVELIPVGTIGAVFEEVNRRNVDFGVVPVENSTDGRVADTLEMFTRLSVRIWAEIPLRIHHCLLAKCPRDQIVEVYSKPQALSQCRDFLNRDLTGVRTIEVTSTSTAAQLASEKPGAAAIASQQAGVHYGLVVLAERIEDNQANLTRFVVIGHESAKRSGHDKTSLMFEVEHKPGALSDATAVLKRNQLNMTWIESFPLTRPEGGYVFFVELNGHENDAKLSKAITALRRKTLRLEILGSYPKSELMD